MILASMKDSGDGAWGLGRQCVCIQGKLEG